jgi:hypothetical protein
MLDVSEIQFQTGGWGVIKYNPAEAERWAEVSAKRGNGEAVKALRAIRATKEITRQKTEQIHRKIIQDRFSEIGTQEPLVGERKWLKKHQRQVRKFEAEGVLVTDPRYQAFLEASYTERNRYLVSGFDETPGADNSAWFDRNFYHTSPESNVPRNVQSPASLDGLHRAMKAALDGHMQHRPYDAVPRPLVEVSDALVEPALRNLAPLSMDRLAYVKVQIKAPVDARMLPALEAHHRAVAIQGEAAAMAAVATADSSSAPVADAGGVVMLPPDHSTSPILPDNILMEKYPELVRVRGLRALSGLARAEVEALELGRRTGGVVSSSVVQDSDRITLRERRLADIAEKVDRRVTQIERYRHRLAAFDERQAMLPPARDDFEVRRRAEHRAAIVHQLKTDYMTPAEIRATVAVGLAVSNTHNWGTEEKSLETALIKQEDIPRPADEQHQVDLVYHEYTHDRFPYIGSRGNSTVAGRYSEGDALAAEQVGDYLAFVRSGVTADDARRGSPEDEDRGRNGNRAPRAVEEGAASLGGDAAAAGAVQSQGGVGGRGSRTQWRARVAAAQQVAATPANE